MKRKDFLKTFAAKKRAKKKLKKEFSLKRSKKSLFLGIYLKESNKKILDTLNSLLEGLTFLDIQIVVVGNNFKKRLPDARSVDSKHLKKVLAASDLMLVLPSKKVIKGDLKGMWQSGAITIIPKVNSKVKDYNPNKETGNSFVYEKDNAWSIFAAIVRALETYKFPYDWQHIVQLTLKNSAKM